MEGPGFPNTKYNKIPSDCGAYRPVLRSSIEEQSFGHFGEPLQHSIYHMLSFQSLRKVLVVSLDLYSLYLMPSDNELKKAIVKCLKSQMMVDIIFFSPRLRDYVPSWIISVGWALLLRLTQPHADCEWTPLKDLSHITGYREGSPYYTRIFKFFAILLRNDFMLWMVKVVQLLAGC